MTKILNRQSRASIEKITGIPFDDLLAMDVGVMDGIIEKKIGKKLKFELAYNKFSELETFLIDNEQHICWARARYYSSKILKLIGWLLAAIISGIISSIYIPWHKLLSFFFS